MSCKCYAFVVDLLSTTNIFKYLNSVIMALEERKCLQCNKRIIGRSDKKFCDDSCRNQFNNTKNQEDIQLVRKLNTILFKNRSILKTLIGNEEMVKVGVDKLQMANFNMKFYTHQYTTQKGVTYYFVYEFGYLLLGYDKILIVKRNPFE